MKVSEIIELCDGICGGKRREKTVDTLKCGDPKAEVSGLAFSFMPTLEVLEKALSLGANMLITHEPLFWGHLDDTDWMGQDPVLSGKRNFIEKHGMAVYRCHDTIHDREPDGILEGTLPKLGWETYQTDKNSTILEFPCWTPRQIAQSAKKALGLSHVRLAGDPDLAAQKVSVRLGAVGGRSQMEDLMKKGVNVVVCGESPEWEACEYVRDACKQNHPMALIVLGHVQSEEAGMEHLCRLIKDRLPSLPMNFIPTGSPFQNI